MAVRLLIIPGSARAGSLNVSLARTASKLALNMGAEPSVIDLRALNLPIYDGHLEAKDGVPKGAGELVRRIHEADALLFVTPEYNSFPPPLLINALDWASRVQAGQGAPSGLAAMAGKPAGLLSASPGGLGGIKSIMALRTFLQGLLGMLVVPQQFSLGGAMAAFSEDGALKDPRQEAQVGKVLEALVGVAGKLGRF